VGAVDMAQANHNGRSSAGADFIRRVAVLD